MIEKPKEVNENNAHDIWVNSRNFSEPPRSEERWVDWVRDRSATALIADKAIYRGNINDVNNTKAILADLITYNFELSDVTQEIGQEGSHYYYYQALLLQDLYDKAPEGMKRSIQSGSNRLNMHAGDEGASNSEPPESRKFVRISKKDIDDDGPISNGLTDALDIHGENFDKYGFDWAVDTYVPSREALAYSLLSKFKIEQFWGNSSPERGQFEQNVDAFRNEVKNNPEKYSVVSDSIQMLTRSHKAWSQIKYTSKLSYEDDPRLWSRAIFKHKVREAIGSSIDVQREALGILSRSSADNMEGQNKTEIAQAEEIYENQIRDVFGYIPSAKNTRDELKKVSEIAQGTNAAYEIYETGQQLVIDVEDIKGEKQQQNVLENKELLSKSITELNNEVKSKAAVDKGVDAVINELDETNLNDGVIQDYLNVKEKITDLTDLSGISEKLFIIADVLGLKDIQGAWNSHKLYKRASGKVEVLSKSLTKSKVIDELTGFSIYGLDKLESLKVRSIILLGSQIAKFAGRILSLVTGGVAAIISESIRLVGSVIEGVEEVYLRLKGFIKKLNNTRGQRRALSAEVIFHQVAKEKVGGAASKLMYDLLVKDKILKKPKLTKPQQFVSNHTPDSKEKKVVVKYLEQYNRGPLSWLVSDKDKLSQVIKYIEGQGERPAVIEQYILQKGYIDRQKFEQKEALFKKLLKKYVMTVLKDLLNSSPLGKATALQDKIAKEVNKFLTDLSETIHQKAFEALLSAESALFNA
ncbi:hypothetical protein [Alteromonas sp. a30]|uniref:hypothetical protein n=1 Tax=Alteromonas sp. a30 TaxID=2730917 RepID=UPI0022825746|nr:hypothetical protein [Alteromonas sp. a30]MCY7296498.1 hypothetical protein [Alteromonas sp. a30]